jgi:exopolyphosphatase/guanosine-5'-triphosphate,3'-diphosphate pyrophosphatase
VPGILASARLKIDADMVTLEVGKGARVPDSEVVRDRLNLVAAALGVSRKEILEAAD